MQAALCVLQFSAFDAKLTFLRLIYGTKPNNILPKEFNQKNSMLTKFLDQVHAYIYIQNNV